MTVARQRLGRHIPGIALSIVEGHPLPGNRSLDTFPQIAEKLLELLITIWSSRNCKGRTRENAQLVQ
jgi:hypothetical protein